MAFLQYVPLYDMLVNQSNLDSVSTSDCREYHASSESQSHRLACRYNVTFAPVEGMQTPEHWTS